MNAHVNVRNTAVLTAIAAVIGAIAAVFASTASSASAAPKVLLESALAFDAKASTITLRSSEGAAPPEARSGTS